MNLLEILMKIVFVKKMLTKNSMEFSSTIDNTNYFGIITSWLREQWCSLTFEHVLYLLAFSFVLSYITEYVLKFKQVRWLYYGVSIVLLIKLFEGGHPVGGVESAYKLILI